MRYASGIKDFQILANGSAAGKSAEMVATIPFHRTRQDPFASKEIPEERQWARQRADTEAPSDRNCRM